MILVRRRWEKKRLVREEARPAVEKPAEEKPQSAAAAAAAAAAVIDAMSDGVALIDMDGKMASVNPAWQKITGLKKSEVVGKNIADIISKLLKPEDLGKVLGFVRAALDGKVAPPIFATIVSKDGREIPVSPTASLIKDAEGKPAAVVATIKDLSEFKRAEEERLRMLRATVEAMPDAVVVFDTEGVALSVSGAFAKIFGYQPEDMVGKHIAEMKGIGKQKPKEVEKFMSLIGEAFEKGSGGPVELTLVARDGREIPVSVAGGAVRNAEGNPTHLVAVLRDITELKKIEAERTRAAAMAAAAEADKAKIAELADTRTALLNILEDTDESKRELDRTVKERTKDLEIAYKELAVLERSRTFAFILFRDVFEPILRECSSGTIGKISDQVKDLGKRLPPAKAVRIGHDGSVTLDEVLLKEALEGMSHEDAAKEITSTFSEIMGMCDPLVRADIGDERATATASKVFSSLFKKPEVSTYKPDLLKIVPDGVELPGLVYKPLEPGECFLVEESKADHAFSMLEDMLIYGFPGLCISTAHPADVKKRHGFRGRGIVLWLSKTERDFTVPPSNLGLLRDRISTFVSHNENAVVLLDGLEYLITMNGFDVALKFLHDVRETIILNRARFIVTVSPGTLEPRQVELLERYMEVIEVVEEER